MKRGAWRELAAGALVAFSASVLHAERGLTLGEYSRESRLAIEARIRQALEATSVKCSVIGTVTYVDDDAFFVQSEIDGLKVMRESTKAAVPPRPGEVLHVDGKPSLEGGRVVMVAKSWHKLETAPLPPPVPATAADLVYGGDSKQDVNWLRVELEGRAIGTTEKGFALNVEGMPITVNIAPLPEFLRDSEHTHPFVAVRGVAELILDQSVLFGRNRYVIGVRLNVSDASEVVLKPDFEYLLNRRSRRTTLAIVALIAALAIGLLVFSIVIHRQRRRLFFDRTVMAERQRMADDIHDTIEQHLVGAGMLIKLGRLKEAESVLVQAKRELRNIIWGLKNDDMLRQTPAAMLRELASAENQRGICQVKTRLEGLPEHLDAAAMRDLSLIVREAIGNAVKHGGAGEIELLSESTVKGWRLLIANDGKSFEVASAPGPAQGHFGMEGMRQRARRLGAKISFGVCEGKVTVTVEKNQ